MSWFVCVIQRGVRHFSLHSVCYGTNCLKWTSIEKEGHAYIQCARFGELLDAAIAVHVEELYTRWAVFVVPL